MTPRTIEALARRADELERDIGAMQALSRTRPHLFAEQKDDLRRRARALAIDIRQHLGARPGAGKEAAEALFPNCAKSSEIKTRSSI